MRKINILLLVSPLILVLLASLMGGCLFITRTTSIGESREKWGSVIYGPKEIVIRSSMREISRLQRDTISDEDVEVSIYEHRRGYGYWKPIQDVSGFHTINFWIEIERYDKKNKKSTIIKTEDLKPKPYESPAPSIMGISATYSYWWAEGGYIMVDHITGEIYKRLLDNKEWRYYKDWKDSGEVSIFYVSQKDKPPEVCEISPEGVRCYSPKEIHQSTNQP
jgi:hypothetical protein